MKLTFTSTSNVGPIRLHQLPYEITPKLCVVVGRVMKYSRGHLAIPMGHMYYSDLLEINKNNMNEGHF